MRLKIVPAVVAACAVAGAGAVQTGGVFATTAAAATYKRVPNVVGMNHQAAQDLLRAMGFRKLRERDCTRRGRLLLLDRNWRVVRQSPQAGRRVSTKRAIRLCSVKYSDPRAAARRG
jgi:beta-lactam-binding protein with PASTA domain